MASASAAVKMQLAEAAYASALQTDTAQAWREAAKLLFAVRRKAAKSSKKCRHPAPIAVATFADGVTVTRGFFSPLGRPMAWRRARSATVAAYTAYRVPWREYSSRQKGIAQYEAARAAVVVPKLTQLSERVSGEVMS